MAALIDTLGGEYGFGENYLDRNDDYYTSAIDITSIFPNGINFYGTTYTSLYVNNNGNITFGSGLYEFTPTEISGGINNPIIAPFWADVDTRGTTVTPTPGGNSKGTNLTWYDLDPDSGTFTVTWDDVGYYQTNVDKLNAFQLQLVNTGNDTFDILYRYEDINWVTGDASDGVGGLGGVPARAGFSAGDGNNYYEFHFSGQENFMLGLSDVILAGSTEPGVWKFSVNSEGVQGIGQENSDDIIYGTESNDIMDGRSGNDILYGGAGHDTISGGEGDDILYGGDGHDQLIGVIGNNILDGGDGTDFVLYTGIRNTIDISRYEGGDATFDALYGDSLARSLNLDNVYVIVTNQGRDIVVNCEYITFDDGSMSIDYAVQVRENQEEFGRFYKALFGRLPDNEGLTYWVNDLISQEHGGNGNTIQGAAQAFTESSEFASLYGDSVTNRDFVNLLYQNILGRDADEPGYDYWLNEIDRDGDRGGMIVSFSNSNEYINLTESEIDAYLDAVPLDGYILDSTDLYSLYTMAG